MGLTAGGNALLEPVDRLDIDQRLIEKGTTRDRVG